MEERPVKMEQVPMEQAYRKIGQMVSRVRDEGEVFLILHGGVPAAALIDIAEFERCVLQPHALILRWTKEGVTLHPEGRVEAEDSNNGTSHTRLPRSRSASRPRKTGNH